jgi:hypothetical protein
VTEIALVAALVLLILTIYLALRTKTSASGGLKDYQTQGVAETVVSHHPDDDAFDAAFKKHIAPHTNKYFNARIAVHPLRMQMAVVEHRSSRNVSRWKFCVWNSSQTTQPIRTP